MILEIDKLVDSYTKWLKDRTQLKEVDEWVEITTPFLDRHNDFLQIYVKKLDTGYILTDGGYILQDLELSGCLINTPKRKDLVITILNGFGVKKVGDSLEVHATHEDFSIKKHNLIQSMLAINDLFTLAVSINTSIFLEDVIDWLNILEVRYSPNIKIAGKSGYDHFFDILIPKSKEKPERLIKTINNPNRQVAESFAFTWIDTRENRQSDTKAYAILNDTEKPISQNIIEALNKYDIYPIQWSLRSEAASALVG